MLKNQAGSLRSNLDKIISNMMLLFSSEIVLPEIPSQKAGSINPRELPHQLGLTAIEKEPERYFSFLLLLPILYIIQF